MRFWPRHFRAQVGLLIMVLAVLGILAFSWFSGRQQARLVLESLLDTGEALATNMSIDSANQLLREDFATLELLLTQYANLPGILRVRIVDADGATVSHVVRDGAATRAVYQSSAVEVPLMPSSTIVGNGQRLALWHPISAGPKHLGFLNLELSLAPSLAARSQLFQTTFVFGLLALLSGVLVLFVFLRRPLRAVQEASTFAAEIDRRRGDSIPVERFSVEFERLGEALNLASARLHEQERAVRGSNARLRAILEHAVDGIVTVDDQLNVLSFNPAAERIFGYSQDAILGRSAQVLFEVPLRFLFGGKRSSGKSSRLQGRRRDGSTFPVEISDSAIVLDGRSLYIAIVRDITERVRNEQALQKSEAEARMLAMVASRTSNAVIITDPQARIEWINDGFTRISGYTLDEVSGKTPGSILQGPGTDPDTVRYMRRKLREGEGFQAELVNYTKAGEAYWIEIDVQPIRDRAGKLVRFIAIESDITERKHAEQELAQQRDFAMTVLNTIGQGLTVVGADWTFEYVNPAYARITGYRTEDLVGRSPLDLAAEDAETELSEVQRARLQGETTSYETRLEHADGHQLDVLITGVPRFQDGAFAGTISVITDITERKRAESELVAARDDAEQANRAKSDFLSRMSHELRTPLNAILGFAQLLELDDLNGDQTESVDRILKAGRHLLDLIDEVLDISRIEAGTIALSLEPIDLCAVVQESVRLIRPLADERRIDLRIDTSVGDHHVLSDQQRLKQVMLNLLSNAVKYNRPAGSVQLRCHDRPGGFRRIEVGDTGIGIPVEKLGRLFVPFDRLDADQTDIEGSGIGLSLTKHLVEAMGGAIGVRSEPGRGTTFWVDLPRASADASVLDLPELEAALAAPATEAHGERFTIVYVEDNLSNIALVERILARVPGVRLLTAMQGQLGLELIRQERPALVLLDLHLPGLGGEEVLNRLKLDPNTREIPVVVMSADATPGRIEAVAATGAVDYLTKPIEVRDLLEVVQGRLRAPADEPTRSGR